MELFPVAHSQDLALRHFIAASVPAVLVSDTDGGDWSALFEHLALMPLCAFDDIEPRNIEEADFLQPY